MADERIAAKWTNDCQGKKDFDGSIVRITTRYWPRGGGFHVMNGGEWSGNESRPEIKPSASAEIVLCHGEPREGSPEGDYATLIEREFEGDTFEEVARDVERWAQDQFEKIAQVVRAAFSA